MGVNNKRVINVHIFYDVLLIILYLQQSRVQSGSGPHCFDRGPHCFDIVVPWSSKTILCFRVNSRHSGNIFSTPVYYQGYHTLVSHHGVAFARKRDCSLLVKKTKNKKTVRELSNAVFDNSPVYRYN